MSDFNRLSIERADGPGWVLCEPCKKRPEQMVDGSWCRINRVVYFFGPSYIAAHDELCRRHRDYVDIVRWPPIKRVY